MRRRQSFTDRRRALLARQVAHLERMEERNMITESLGILSLGIGVPAVAAALAPQNASDHSSTGTESGKHAHNPALSSGRRSLIATAIVPKTQNAAGGGRKTHVLQLASHAKGAEASDWLTLSRKSRHKTSESSGSLSLKRPAKAPQGGGAALSHGTGGSLPRGAIVAYRVPTPPAAPSTASSMVVAAGPSAGSTTPTPSLHASQAASHPAETTTSTGSASPSTPVSSPAMTASPLLGQSSSSGGTSSPSVGIFSVAGAGSENPATGSFTYFPVYTVDYNDGVVLFPGFVQLATPSGSVDLRAQVRDTTVSSYSWDTTGLVDAAAASITGTNTYDLQFEWNSGFPPSRVDSVTLTVTDGNGDQEVQTYSFAAIGSVASGTTTTPTWPKAISPDTVLPGTDTTASQNVSVGIISGALDTSIALPSYNPNVSALALTYDSLTADPRPIIVDHHTIDPAQSEPSQVSAQLTFDGTAGTTYYYDTSLFNPGDIQQIAVQADATGLSTDRYGYSVAVGDIRGTTTTTTDTGTATVLNNASSAFGDGWTLQGLEQITAASGGVILDLGNGGQSLWFTGSPGSGGGTYTDPAGEFSTLARNSDSTYTRTFTDGTKIAFDTSGREQATIDRSGLRVTYSYDSGGKLTTITDPYSNVTTFAYDGNNKLQTITDPAGRVATFTHSGGNLTGATLPDSSSWSYGYDSGGRLTQVTDPNAHTTSIAYDSAERVGTITRPDSSVETFVSEQERGWTNSGTSGSPAAATLLAEARSSHTDPLSNTSDVRPDWYGRGLTNQTTDPSGNVATLDRDANGLATVAIDQDNRITQETFDTKGNPVTITYPSLNTDHYTYNSFSEPLTHTDGNSHTTSYTYDSNGNLTVLEDPLTNLTTMTYTADGKLATETDANTHTTSYAYDYRDAYCSPCRKAHWLAGRVDAARHQITLRKFNEHRVLNVLISNPGLLHRAA